MFHSFGVRNYFCFKEGAEISLKFDKKVPKEISPEFFESIGTVFGIKGANGSGKTKLIKALKFISMFSTISSTSPPSKPIAIPIINYFRNSEPTDFYIEFEIDDVIYTYEITLTEEKVIREAIYKKLKRTILLVERKEQKITECLKEFDELRSLKLRSDASFISVFKHFEFNKEMNELEAIWEKLNKIRSNVSLLGYENLDSEISLSKLSEIYLSDEELFTFTKKLVKRSDDSIADIIIKDRTNDEGDKEYYPIFIHSGDGENIVTYSFESNGVKVLYKVLSYYWQTLKDGGLLCMDEFDIHLHSMILPELLSLFLDERVNKNKAQLIFTAHNTEIIDFLGKYRTILVNKEVGESYCYRLDELKGSLVRNDRPITPTYLQGKIGGVPLKNG